MTADGRGELAWEVVEHLIDTTLLVAEADGRSLAVTDAEVSDYIAQQYDRLGMTEAQFTESLATQGIDIRDFREFIHGNLTRVRMIQLDVASRVSVSQAEIDRMVEERYPDGLEEILLESSHVLVPVMLGAGDEAEAAARERIEGFYDEIVAGTRTFEQIAGVVNPDASRNTGGRLGRYSTRELDPDYVRGALALEVGEVSTPVRTQFGYHLIRLESLARTPVSDAQAIRDEIHFELHQRAAAQQEALYLERKRNQAFIEFLVTEIPM